jgi:hypothetical protein
MVFTPIQNQSFIEVQNDGGAIAPAFNSPILLTCKDLQGNTIPKTIVEISAIGGFPVLDIMLPSIESLGNDLNCEIQFIVKNNATKVQILRFDDGINPPIDTIGQNGNFGFLGRTAGAVFTLTPAYEGYWTLNETIN